MDMPCAYDVILGHDFLSCAGIELNFNTGVVKWLDKTIMMKDQDHWDYQSNWVCAIGAIDEKDEEDGDLV